MPALSLTECQALNGKEIRVGNCEKERIKRGSLIKVAHWYLDTQWKQRMSGRSAGQNYSEKRTGKKHYIERILKKIAFDPYLF